MTNVKDEDDRFILPIRIGCALVLFGSGLLMLGGGAAVLLLVVRAAMRMLQ